MRISIAFFLIASLAYAQPVLPTLSGRIVSAGNQPYAVLSRWTRTAQGRSMAIEVGAPGTTGTTVWHGRSALVDSAANDHGIFIAMVSGDRDVTTVFVPIAEGRLGTARTASVHRIVDQDRSPIGVSVAVRGDGFTAFWQEASNSNPGALYTTFAVDADGAGAPARARALSAVQWPIAAAAWMGDRWMLALYFGGQTPDGTRLCAVHVAEDRPQEHPWWATRAGMITEVQLIATPDGHVHALYRGGHEGRDLLSSDVTNGSWGAEAAAPSEHGAIAENEIFGGRWVDRITIERATPH